MTQQLTERQQEVAAITQRGALMGGWSNNEALVIHRMYAPATNQAEFMAFARVCRTTGLDPMNGEIFCMVYSPKEPKKRKMVLTTAVAGYRKIGFATGEVKQLVGPHWLGEDGEWVDVWLGGETPPVAARFGIAREGMIEPRMVTVLWSEFAKDVTKIAGDFWKRMPAHMLAKVAESQCWRAVFPAQLNQLHDVAETGDALPPPDVMTEAIEEPLELDALPAPADEPDGYSGPDWASIPAENLERTAETAVHEEEVKKAKGEAKPKPPKGVTPDAIVGAVEVAMKVQGVTHEQVGSVTGATEDGDVAAWVLQQMGDEQTLPAMNTAIATLCEMAAEA